MRVCRTSLATGILEGMFWLFHIMYIILILLFYMKRKMPSLVPHMLMPIRLEVNECKDQSLSGISHCPFNFGSL